MAILRKCVCCDKEYEYCPNCAKGNNKPAWMMSFCSEGCKELFNLVSAYNMRLIGKAKVQAFVAEHGIKDFGKYTDAIRKVLEETDNAPKPMVVKPVEVVSHEEIIKPVIENNVEEKAASDVVESISAPTEEVVEEKKKSPARTSIRRRRKLT